MLMVIICLLEYDIFSWHTFWFTVGMYWFHNEDNKHFLTWGSVE